MARLQNGRAIPILKHMQHTKNRSIRRTASKLLLNLEKKDIQGIDDPELLAKLPTRR